MTREDYRAFAAILAAERSMARHNLANDGTEGEPKLRVTRNIVLSMADVFAADNPRFDRAHFYAACGVGDPHAINGEAGEASPRIAWGHGGATYRDDEVQN